MSRLKRILTESIKNFTINLRFSIACIFTTIACTFFIGVFFLFGINVYKGLLNVQNHVAISVFFNKDVDEYDVLYLKNKLEKLPEVKEVKYISGEEALEIFAKNNEFDEELINSLKDDNPLKDSSSLEIYYNDVENIPKIKQYLEKESIVRKIKDSSTITNELLKMIKISVTILVTIFIILVFIAVILINLNIANAISIRKEEINTMRLMGATNLFIASPYIMEGILISALGTLPSAFSLFYMYKFIEEYIIKYNINLIFNIRILPLNDVYIYMFGIVSIFGFLIGIFGSMLAITKVLISEEV